MKNNQFYQRLNQIRNKYGYNNHNQPSKNTTVSYHQPQNHAQTYRDVTTQNNCSPLRIQQQNSVSKNNLKAEIQKTYNLGISPTRNLDRQKSQNNTTLRQDRLPQQRQRQAQPYLNQTLGYDVVKPAFKNVTNENFSPSPIKKLRIECSYQSSPTKKDSVFEMNQDYQALKPYNRMNYDAVADLDKNARDRQTMNTYRNQNKPSWPQTPSTTKSINRTFKNESPYDCKPPNSARHSVGYEVNSFKNFEAPQNIDKDSVFMQKFDYNVKNIQKVQDKINSILNRQK